MNKRDDLYVRDWRFSFNKKTGDKYVVIYVSFYRKKTLIPIVLKINEISKTNVRKNYIINYYNYFVIVLMRFFARNRGRNDAESLLENGKTAGQHTRTRYTVQGNPVTLMCTCSLIHAKNN